MTSVLAFFKNIRKQPRGARSLFFAAILIVFVPLTLYAWSVSFYRGLQNISLNPQEEYREPPVLGEQIGAKIQEGIGQMRQGFGYVANSVSAAVADLHLGEWLRDTVRKLRGKPEILPAEPQTSGIELPLVTATSSGLQ